MNCDRLKKFQKIKESIVDIRREEKDILKRLRCRKYSGCGRACVSLVSTQCSGVVVSTSSMADPASLSLAAVSVTASNSRQSTRKRHSNPQHNSNNNQQQIAKTNTKRPRTRSQVNIYSFFIHL